MEKKRTKKSEGPEIRVPLFLFTAPPSCLHPPAATVSIFLISPLICTSTVLPSWVVIFSMVFLPVLPPPLFWVLLPD
jgi:hypothetical protein